MLSKQAQSAIEFMLTYLWAILALIVIFGAIISFGLFDISGLFFQEKCELFGGFRCSDATLTDTAVLLSVQNTKAEAVVVTEGTVNEGTSEICTLTLPQDAQGITIFSGSAEELFFSCSTPASDKTELDVVLGWYNRQVGSTSSHQVRGLLALSVREGVTLSKPLNFPCTMPSECLSNNCVGGVCTGIVTCSLDTDCPAEGGVDGYCSSQQCALCSATTPYRVAGSCVECRVGMSDCMSGSCVSGVCQTLLAVGAACGNAEECGSGLCENSVCVSPLGGACSATNECTSGNICDAMSRRCVVPAGGACGATSECVSGSSCDMIVDGSGVCRLPVSGACSANGQCLSGLCDVVDDVGVCKSAIGGSCSTDSQCLSGECVSGLCDYRIVNFAGNGTAGSGGDGGAATNAQLNRSFDVFVNGSDVFIADANNNRVRRVDSNNIISTFAGNGVQGFAGDGVVATSARLNRPRDVAVSGNDVFIADANNGRVRRVNASGNISTIAGGGSSSGSPAVMATLSIPFGLFLNDSEVFVALRGNHLVRKLTPDGNGGYTISAVAGTGSAGSGGDGGVATSAQLNLPLSVAVLDNEVFIADFDNNRVRKIDVNGNISTIAGTGTPGFSEGGTNNDATMANLNQPFDISVSVNGEIFIADRKNHLVRKLTSNMDGTAYTISTVAGNRSECTYSATENCGNDGPATSAGLNDPRGVFVAASGDVFVADADNHLIRKLCVNASDCP